MECKFNDHIGLLTKSFMKLMMQRDDLEIILPDATVTEIAKFEKKYKKK